MGGAGRTALTPPHCLACALPSVPGHWTHGWIRRWKKQGCHGNGCHQGGRDRPGPSQGDATAARHLVRDGMCPWGSPHLTPAFSSVQNRHVRSHSSWGNSLLLQPFHSHLLAFSRNPEITASPSIKSTLTPTCFTESL